MKTTEAFRKLTSTVAAIVAEFNATAEAEYQRENAERIAAEQATGTTFDEASKGTNPVSAPAPLMTWWHNQRDGLRQLARQRHMTAVRIQQAHCDYTTECLRIFAEGCSEYDPIAARVAGDAVMGLVAESLQRHPLPWIDSHTYNGWLACRGGVQKTLQPEIAELLLRELLLGAESTS